MLVRAFPIVTAGTRCSNGNRILPEFSVGVFSENIPRRYAAPIGALRIVAALPQKIMYRLNVILRRDLFSIHVCYEAFAPRLRMFRVVAQGDIDAAILVRQR